MVCPSGTVKYSATVCKACTAGTCSSCTTGKRIQIDGSVQSCVNCDAGKFMVSLSLSNLGIFSGTAWTMAIASQTITASAGVVVTQGVGATSVTGTLKTALVGDTTSVIILTASDVTFLTTKDVIIGSSTTVAHTDVVTATNNGLHRQSACQVCTV